MFGSLFRIGLLTTLVGGSAFALVGPERIKMFVLDGKESILSALDEVQGMESRLKMIKSEIGDLNDEMRRLREEAVRHRVETERLEEDVFVRGQSLERRAATLEKASVLLAGQDDSFEIGGRIYSRTEVERDASEKLALYNVQAETLENLQQTLATKKKAQGLAEENVGRAKVLRTQMASKVTLLEAELQKYRAKETFAATVEEAVDTSDLDSDLARARELIKSFEQELEVQDRMLDERLNSNPATTSGGIDYEVFEAKGGDLVEQIQAVLGTKPELRGSPLAVMANDVTVVESHTSVH